jgi:hypothetical protein
MSKDFRTKNRACSINWIRRFEVLGSLLAEGTITTPLLSRYPGVPAAS